VQPITVPCGDWTEVDANGVVRSLQPPQQPRRYSFPGVAEFKEADENEVMLSVTIDAYIFCIIVPKADYASAGSPSGSFPIEVLTLTYEGYSFWNTHWAKLEGVEVSARMLHTS
jgi:hypothetical protein